MVIKLAGRIISKKNSKRFFRHGRRVIPVSSRAYQTFEARALSQLTGYKTIEPPYDVHVDFYIKGAYRADGDNLYTSILDVLQKAGIITDDLYIMRGSWEKYPSVPEWGTTIIINRYKGKNG